MSTELAPILAVARSLDDAPLAQLLRAQCERLRDESPSTREHERACKRAWLAAAPCRHLRLHHLFAQNVTAFDDDDGRHVWAYDSDLMSAQSLSDRTRARLRAALPQANLDADDVDRMALDLATVGWCSGTR